MTTAVSPVEAIFKTARIVLENYANVHRGSGFNSIVTTNLYDKSRDIVLDFFGLNAKSHQVVYFSKLRFKLFEKLHPNSIVKSISSNEIGLNLGIVAVALKKSAKISNHLFHTGGGTTKLYSKTWVMWADVPDLLEAGTPAIVNVIVFAKALQLTKKFGNDVFKLSASKHIDGKTSKMLPSKSDYQSSDGLQYLKSLLIGRDNKIPTRKGLASYVNFDNSASTRTFEPIFEAFCENLFKSSNNSEQLLNDARSVCANFFNAPKDKYDIFFTSNTTEAINILADNIITSESDYNNNIVVNTILEHSSNELSWRKFGNDGLITIPANNNGIVDINALEQVLIEYNFSKKHSSKRVRLVTISGASNVLGTCNDLKKISRIVHEYGAELLVDAAQLAAHRPIDMEGMGIDYLVLSAHKIYAPFGTGLLVAARDKHKFTSEKIKLINESGEVNIAGVAALGKSLELISMIGFDAIVAEEQVLIGKAVELIAKIPDLKILGFTSKDELHRKVAVMVFDTKNNMPGRIAKRLMHNAGVGVRYGCHCAHLIVKQLNGFTPFQEKFQKFVLKAVPILKLQGYLRISFGLENTEQEVEMFASELARAMKAKDETGLTIDKKQTAQQIKEQVDRIEKEIFE